jgi:hypothetical protein
VLVIPLGGWEISPPRPLIREGDPKGWSTVLIIALGSWEKERERRRYPKGWSTVLITALGGWEK